MNTPESPFHAELRRQVVLAGHTGDIDMVLKALEHELPMVRDVALGALSRMDKLEIEILRRFRTDPDARVRKRVAELAATFPDFDLLPLLNDDDPMVAEMAEIGRAHV